MIIRNSRPILSILKKAALMQLLMAINIMTVEPALGQDADSGNRYSGDRMTLGFETNLASKYLWRGLAFSQNAVSQNSIWMSKMGLTGIIWSNYDFKAEKENPSFNELDLAMTYESFINRIGIETSVQAYFYPDQPESPSTAEISVRPSYDFSFFELFTNHTFDIGEYESALELAFREVNATWNLSDYLYLKPHVILSTILDRNIRALLENTTLFQIGIVLGGEF